MPSNFLAMDNDFPTFTGEESPKQQIQALHNYLYQLREGLQYSLQNLSAENFNAAAWQNLTDVQKNEVATQVQQVMNVLNQLSTKLDSLAGRVGGIENLSGRVNQLDGAINGEGGLQERMTEMETAVAGEGGLEEQVSAIEDAITGEGGLEEQLSEVKEVQAKQSKVIAVAEDGSAAIGAEDKRLDLIGEIYINGVLVTQGGST